MKKLILLLILTAPINAIVPFDLDPERTRQEEQAWLEQEQSIAAKHAATKALIENFLSPSSLRTTCLITVASQLQEQLYAKSALEAIVQDLDRARKYVAYKTLSHWGPSSKTHFQQIFPTYYAAISKIAALGITADPRTTNFMLNNLSILEKDLSLSQQNKDALYLLGHTIAQWADVDAAFDDSRSNRIWRDRYRRHIDYFASKVAEIT